jgi:hypothetical protein
VNFEIFGSPTSTSPRRNCKAAATRDTVLMVLLNQPV